VQRWDEETFLIVTGSGQINRDIPWIRSQIARTQRVALLDVTSAWSLLGLAGPNAEALLQRLCPDDTDLSTLQPYHHREIELGFARTRLARMSYTGEPGFEILLPTDMTAGLYDCLHDAGHDLGLRDIGSIAVNSLRLEHGFRSWGHDLSPGVTPFEAGLQRFIAWDKAGEFRGREALMGLRDATPTRRLISFSLADADGLPFGGEPLFRADRPMGQVTSTGYGYGAGRAIGLAYVAADAFDGRGRVADLEIEIACQRFQIDARRAP
jgi:4-methylaminobutanoate oxidase (formaldehyde-forming)